MLRLRTSLAWMFLLLGCSSSDGSSDVVDAAPSHDSSATDSLAPATDIGAGESTPPTKDATDDATATEASSETTADAPPPIDFSTPGTFTVTKSDSTIGSNAVHLLVPAGGAPHGAVAFAHGFQLTTTSYDGLLGHLASWGWIVVSTDYPGSLFSVDHRNVRDAILAARSALIAGSITGVPKVDASKIVAAGHSLGGKGAIMALISEPSFAAGLAFDPVDGSPGPGGGTPSDSQPVLIPTQTALLKTPVAYFGATQSHCGGSFGTPCAPTGMDAQAFFGATPTSIARALWIVDDFGHMQFLDASCGFVCSACVAGTSDPAPRMGTVKSLSVAWLEAEVGGDAAAKSAMDATTASATSAKLLWDGTSAEPACP